MDNSQKNYVKFKSALKFRSLKLMCKIRESKYSNFEFKETRVKIYNLKIKLN